MPRQGIPVKALAGILAFAFLAIFLAQAYYGAPLHRDVLESWRSAEYLQQHQRLPVENANVNEPPTRYPPVFSILLVETSALLNLGLEDATTALAYPVAFLLILSVFLFVRSATQDVYKALLAALASMLVPWLFYRMAYPIPETLGISLLFLGIHLYAEKRGALLALLLLGMPFLHFRSAAPAFAILGIAAFREKRLREFLPIALPGAVLYLLTVPHTALQLQNPLLATPGPAEILGLLAIVLGLTGLAMHWKKYGSLPRFAFEVAAAFIITSLVAPLAFRQLIYLAPLVLLGVSEALHFARNALPGLAFFAVLFMAAFIQYRAPVVSPEYQAGLTALQSAPANAVLAGFETNYLIPWYAKKKVVVGPYAEELQDGNARLKDLQAFGFGNEAEIRQLANKYATPLVLLNHPPSLAENSTEKLLDGGAFSAYRVQLN